MNSLNIIKRTLSEPVLSSGLQGLIVVSPPATPEQISVLEATLPRRLSELHRRLLLTWNGLDLDVVRFYAAPPARSGVRLLPEGESLISPSAHPSWIAVASDPAGFLYAEDVSGAVWSIDQDGGEETRLAFSLDEFIGSYIFGERAAEFAEPAA